MKFNPNSSFFRFMGTLASFALLNWVFLLTCLPIFTIGAALTAMHATQQRYLRIEATPLTKTYLQNFKRNFLQATGAWLIVLVLAAVFGFNIAFWRGNANLLATPVLVLMVLAAVVLVLVVELVMPLIGLFQNTVRQTFKNAVLMIIPNFFWVLLLIAIDGCAFAIFYLTNIGRAMFLIFGFAFWQYIKAFAYRRILAKYTDEI
ncbi:YesL family protein [Lacticaseibacillus parakribbianus]|uniref:YesL family protein n=1 Tax=Lacticaseibacillus parakribbianus TaxID=2970927 RepID=UPI0021CB0AD0|nr:YesL family protein [Lacticaseibacillus parakribbianus]